VRVPVIVLLVLAAAAAGCSDDDGDRTEATPTTSARGSVADSRAEGWSVYGHDLSNTRRNLDERAITPQTVDRLRQRWSRSGLVGVSGTPAVVDGTAYFGDWTGMVRAVDVATGDERWAAEVGGWVVGAPAVDGDAVYASSGHTLFRLDRDTGREVWRVDVNDHPLAQINASPVVVDGLVLQGAASVEVAIPRPEYTFRGTIGAYDAETGEERWRVYTTDADERSGPGVGIWSTPAVDRDRGVLYVGSGNTYAEPTAPLADSILAIDLDTGELVWSTQFTAPDVFSAGNPTGKDADVGASPNLWTSDGRELVGAGDKAGVYHALDRETGEVVWETRLTAGSFFGGEIGSAAFVDERIVAVSNVGDADTNAPTNVAKVFALDPASGELRWTSDEYEGMIFGPVGAVPGLAFVGTSSGAMVALDTATGEELWSFQAPDKVACGPSIVDGNLLWGYGYTLFSGGGDGGVVSFSVED
jgi:polyvinyl alcohol dehydrogenase (cytochrome)